MIKRITCIFAALIFLISCSAYSENTVTNTKLGQNNAYLATLSAVSTKDNETLYNEQIDRLMDEFRSVFGFSYNSDLYNKFNNLINEFKNNHKLYEAFGGVERLEMNKPATDETILIWITDISQSGLFKKAFSENVRIDECKYSYSYKRRIVSELNESGYYKSTPSTSNSCNIHATLNITVNNPDPDDISNMMKLLTDKGYESDAFIIKSEYLPNYEPPIDDDILIDVIEPIEAYYISSCET